MKLKNRLVALAFIILNVLLLSCGVSHTSAEKAKKAELLNEQVSNLIFNFKATYAYPQNFSSIYLSPYYDVKVSPDTVVAYLPFYGRAYSAPMNSSEGGIKFTSTKFEYDIQKGKKAGNWLVTIHTKDTQRPFTLYFDLWENGTARLNVHDTDRQSISFSGDIE